MLTQTQYHIRVAEKIDNPVFVTEVVEPSVPDSIPSSTTNFTNSENTAISSMVNYIPLNSTLLSNAIMSEEQDLKAFLMKPYRLLSGVLSSTDVSSTFSNFIVPQSITANEPYASKLKGFLGMRADVVLRFQVNANKFQAGRYILAFCPTVGSQDETLVNTTRFANLTTVTQLPHVEIDINTETEAILKIPYVAVLSHLPIVNATSILGILGYCRIFPYSPVVSVAGSTTATYEIYANFENIELAAPCVPQSSKFVPNNVTLEQKSAGVGPISGSAKKIGAAANLIGNAVPGLTALATPVVWAADLLAGVASIFGWSKPINLEAPTRMAHSSFPYSTNCDAVDNSMPISLFAKNQVEIMPGFAGSDLDEMTLSYLVAKPAYFTYFTWTTAQAADTVLFQSAVGPQNFAVGFASGIVTAYTLPPINYFASFFRYFRGGIRYTFKIIKTEFHSGRISVTFNPAAPGVGATYASAATSAYVHREIIDIRTGTSFDFIVPYVSLVPYRDVTETIGGLQIQVLNPLIAPATVSSTITFVVEVAGAPDFELAVPHQNTTFSTLSVYNPQASSFVPKQDLNSIVSGVIGGSKLTSDQHISARACIGEKTLSILSLLKKYNLRSVSATASVAFDPFALPYNNTTAVTVSNIECSDQITLFSLCFAVSRGSLRLKVIPTATTATNTNYLTTLVTTASGTYNGPTAATYPRSRNPNFIYRSSYQGNGVEVQVPQYSTTYGRSTLAECFNTARPKNYANPTNSNINVMLGMDSTQNNYIYTAAGDDFQLGYFIGCPIVNIVADTT